MSWNVCMTATVLWLAACGNEVVGNVGSTTTAESNGPDDDAPAGGDVDTTAMTDDNTAPATDIDEPPVIMGTPPSPNIAAWGDSLTAGDGGVPYPTQLMALLPGREIFTGGYSGQSSTQIAEHFHADTGGRAGWVNVLWLGRNGYPQTAQVEADIAGCVAALTTYPKRFIVLGILNAESEPKGTGGYNQVVALNADLAAIYAGNFIDIRKIIVDSYDPTSSLDVAAHDNDITPYSVRVDGIHMNAAGYGIVAREVAAFIQAKGW